MPVYKNSLLIFMMLKPDEKSAIFLNGYVFTFTLDTDFKFFLFMFQGTIKFICPKFGVKLFARVRDMAANILYCVYGRSVAFLYKEYAP